MPQERCTGKDAVRFFQYTIPKEAKILRFIYASKQNSFPTIAFVKRTILYFDYVPHTIRLESLCLNLYKSQKRTK